MMERMKSIVLTLLVIVSLVQSYFLAYSSPKFDNVVQTDYVQTEVIGTQAEIGNVLFPEQIILHSGDNKHTLLPLNLLFYNMIYDNFLKNKLFDGFTQSNTDSLSINWDYIRKTSKGIELRFKQGVPMSVLQSVLQIKQDTPPADDIISRIWIYVVRNTEEVHTFFFSDQNSVVYEAKKVDISASNIDRYVGLGQSLPTYHSVTGDYYLPDNMLTMARIQTSYSEFTADQLKKSLFVDPSLIRYLVERDGTKIYTDSKKGLQLKNDIHWMSYSDPISTPMQSSDDIKENLNSSIQFINQHGGWNGTFNYNRMSPDPKTGTMTMLFRQYMDNFPLIGLEPNKFGYIKLVLQNGVVSGYERSLINIENKNVVMTEDSLPGGKILDDLLNKYDKRLDIVTVFPAYQVVVLKGEKVDLIPRWAVELKDGTNEFIN
jgi:regulatory protein YycH of two-component signal transduction system YycFG